jgi:hypothetical protein
MQGVAVAHVMDFDIVYWSMVTFNELILTIRF